MVVDSGRRAAKLIFLFNISNSNSEVAEPGADPDTRLNMVKFTIKY